LQKEVFCIITTRKSITHYRQYKVAVIQRHRDGALTHATRQLFDVRLSSADCFAQ